MPFRNSYYLFALAILPLRLRISTFTFIYVNKDKRGCKFKQRHLAPSRSRPRSYCMALLYVFLCIVRLQYYN